MLRARKAMAVGLFDGPGIQTVELTTGVTDTFIKDDAPTTNSGSLTVLDVGETGGVARVNRSLIKFTLSSIPSSAVVQSATLSLYLASSLSSNPGTVEVYRQLRAWVEAEATWNIYSTGNNWATAGAFGAADCEQTNIGSKVISNTPTGLYIDISLTASAIQEMIAGTFTNNGFLLKSVAELDDGKRFSSMDAASNKPKLTIVYRGTPPL